METVLLVIKLFFHNFFSLLFLYNSYFWTLLNKIFDEFELTKCNYCQLNKNRASASDHQTFLHTFFLYNLDFSTFSNETFDKVKSTECNWSKLDKNCAFDYQNFFVCFLIQVILLIFLNKALDKIKLTEYN